MTAITKEQSHYRTRTKHIDTQWYLIREKAASGKIPMQYIPIDQQIADGLTKSLAREKFEAFRRALGVIGR